MINLISYGELSREFTRQQNISGNSILGIAAWFILSWPFYCTYNQTWFFGNKPDDLGFRRITFVKHVLVRPLRPISSGRELMNLSFTYCENFVGSNADSNDPIRSHICTAHGRSAVTACVKLWPGINTIFHVWMTYILTRYGLWAYHIEAETKWSPFSRRHPQLHFLQWKCMNFH